MQPIGLSVFATGLLAGFISICLTPLVIKVAHKRGWFDDPSDPRKIHNGNVPRLGGVAMFWSFFAALSVATFIGSRNGESSPWGPIYLPVSLCLILVHGIGLVDDFRSLRARYKLVVQSLAALLLVSLGFRFRMLPLPGLVLELGWASYPVSVIWIVGVMNAINFIDGLDGLAGGISIIAAFAYGVIYSRLGLAFPALASFALVGAISGFLVFNFPKGKIFMGDSGSLFLGFLLALLPLLHKSSYPVEAGIIPAITVLLVPIFDVFAAMLRRSRRGQNVMTPDREHLHHKLLDLGFENRQILGIVYGTCLFLAGVTLGGLFLPAATQFWIYMTVWGIVLGAFIVVHFRWHKMKLTVPAAPELACDPEAGQ
jgi:UDP-GlcNAc:undecaprenyl-phosphate GlcNAc-1-phosphate transferase